ncbi:hypothetical protein HHI36_013730 [Cryptolaemus montrouzieri]|uniref:Uncharacterized protein n=1 Tax=Cryptolaemus montrouzieri TaxID=559131 RepID=A0ABD2NI87_9CUCU
MREDIKKAVIKGDIPTIQYLLKNGADPNDKDINGITLLHYAVNNGQKDSVKILLTNGADVTCVSNKGNTPLHIATSKCYIEIVEMLLQHISCDKLNDFVNAKTTSNGTTSLHVAAENGFFEVLKSLLKHGAIYNIGNKEGKTPINLSKDQKVVDFLKLVQELFEGTQKGKDETINKLKQVKPEHILSLGNAHNKQGNTLLQVAIINGHKNIVDQLLKMLKDPETVQLQVSRDLDWDQLEMLKSVVELHIYHSDIYLSNLWDMSEPYGSKVNACPWNSLKEGSYYLQNANKILEAYENCVPGPIDNKFIQLINDALVALEFDVNQIKQSFAGTLFIPEAVLFLKGTKHYNLLHSELKKDIRSFLEMVKINIDIPAKRFLESIKQRLQTAETLLEAIKRNNPFEVENCIKNGVSINFEYKNGRTPLYIAVNSGSINVMRMLLDNGVKMYENSNRNDTLLHIASSKGYSEGKLPIDLSEGENVTKLLKLIGELFEGIKHSNLESISKLKALKRADLLAITNACNNEGKTLLQVAIANGHENFSNQLLEMLKEPEPIQLQYSHKNELDQLEELKDVAETHIKFSDIYLPKLRNMSEPYDSEINGIPWLSLKEGSYYLRNAHNIVNEYKNSVLGPIDNKNIQLINDTLVGLEFNPEHLSSGYTYEAYDGTAKCFVSKGQGAKYYNILHSSLKADIRVFIEMVKLHIDIPAKKFLKFINQKLQSAQMLIEAIKINNYKGVENCIKMGVINFKDTNGKAPLHHAVNEGNIDVVRALLKNGARVTQITENGSTTLHSASSKGYCEIIDALLQYVDADELKNFIDAETTPDGNTSLHVACKNGFLEVAKSLLKYGATYNIKNNEGKLPIELSEDQNIIELLNLIEELFRKIKIGDVESICTLKAVRHDEFLALTNACNNEETRYCK